MRNQKIKTALNSSPPRNIYLTGFMGSGKSTVGRLLAQKLMLQHIDLDAAIEEQEKLSTREIFQTKGEAHFRKIERALLKKVSQSNRLVVSLGGGTLLDEVNRTIVRKHGLLFYLKCSQVELVNRLWKIRATRPLLASLETRSGFTLTIQKLMHIRNESFNSGDFILNVTKLSPTQVAKKIETTWKELCQ